VLSVNCNLIIQRDRNGGLKCAHTRGVQVHREGDRQIERERERERERRAGTPERIYRSGPYDRRSRGARLA